MPSDVPGGPMKPAASNAAPHPPKTNHKVPKNSAAARRDMSMTFLRFNAGFTGRNWRLANNRDGDQYAYPKMLHEKRASAIAGTMLFKDGCQR